MVSSNVAVRTLDCVDCFLKRSRTLGAIHTDPTWRIHTNCANLHAILLLEAHGSNV